jgi:P27 family predicted phage terminase small subunit
MRGPPPTPNHLKLLRGNPGRRPIRDAPAPDRAPECPAAPDFLAGYACDEWHAVAPQLHALGLLTVLDVAPLAAYCTAYGRWRTALEVLGRAGDGGLIQTDTGPKPHPLVGVARNAAADMLRFAGEFGMTPAARTRLATSLGGPSGGGKFDGLLA